MSNIVDCMTQVTAAELRLYIVLCLTMFCIKKNRRISSTLSKDNNKLHCNGKLTVDELTKMIIGIFSLNSGFRGE